MHQVAALLWAGLIQALGAYLAMWKLTFEKILVVYLLIAALLALFLPLELAIEHFAPINPALVPFAGWLRRIPGALPFLTTYFFALTALLPIVIAFLARHPQEQSQFQYRVPTLWRCVSATLVALAVVGLASAGMYGRFFIDSTEQGRGAMLAYAAAVSRLGLVVVGPLLMGTVALVLYVVFIKIPRMWRGLKAGTFG